MSECGDIFIEARASFPSARMQVSHPKSGASMIGLRGPREKGKQIGTTGEAEGTQNSVRLLVAEMGNPRPASGDVLLLTEDGADVEVRIINERMDQCGATILYTYGDKYKGQG